MMALASANAQATSGLPRLVVNILVDQLRTDYLEAFAPLYGEGGLKRLMTEARYYADVQQPFRAPDRASATACLSTGAAPYDNGIPALSWLSRKTLQPVFCVDDPEFAGQQTAQKSSPRHLLTTALSDELEMATGQKSVVYSICPERDMAVLLAGHAADGAFWMNDENGSWCGTSFYGTYPYWAEVYERMSPLSHRIGKLVWEPLYEGGVTAFHYFHSVADTKGRDFRHQFTGAQRYRQLKNTALVNDEVVEFVHRCLEGSDIGKDYLTDLLHVGLYAGNYDHQSVVSHPSEMQDTYARLDRALAQLFEDIEKIVGRQNVLYVVSSTGYADSDADDIDFQRLRIPTGTFSMQRASMLLNVYLTAVYGQAQWVEGVHGNQLYLDRKLIEQRQMNLNEVLDRAEDFLSQMEGVRGIYSASRLVVGEGAQGLERVRAGWNASRSGDLVIEVNPGWRIAGADGSEHVNQGDSYLSFPLFFLGPDVRTERISAPVSTAAVAPTLARCLHIRAPNGSTEAPLVLK